MIHRPSVLVKSAVLLCLAAAISAASAKPPKQAPKAAEPEHWVSAWGSAQMVAEGNNALAADLWADASLRQIVRISLPAQMLRVRISNVFGSTPLRIDAGAVALARQVGSPELQPGTVRELRFMGEPSVTIPPGAEYLSDPVELQAAAGADLAVSLHLPAAPTPQTGHPGSRSKSFVIAGNQVTSEQWNEPRSMDRWYLLADVEVRAPRSVGAVVALGDSITDGYGVKADANTRWTDFLFRRLQGESKPLQIGIVNTGIGGGRLLRDGLGPNLSARFEREVLGRSGVSHAVVLIGVNDLGVQHRNKEDSPEARAQLLVDLKAALHNIAQRAHAHGICVIGGTVTPYTGSDYYKPGPDNDADRQALNRWIRESGTFDGVADFDAATRDPAHPEQLAAWAGFGDGLHLSADGQKALAEAIPLKDLGACTWSKEK
jgi:lysophospholipase L1-like esterase